jgi:pimeloyl-ACP methyl ester carboxylesterase
LYSFPSRGSPSWRAFANDVSEASRTEGARQLSDFLRNVHSQTGARKIHIVAHSLGCEILARALDNMADKDGAQVRRRFDEVIFAAPAVPRMNFREMVSKSCNLWQRATFYTSSRDIPLRLLSWWEKQHRAGIDPRSLADIPNVNGIDTTADRSWLGSLFNSWGHNDFTDSAIDDLRAIVWLSLKPAGRRERIEPKPTAEQPEYWSVIPKTRAQLAVFIQSLLRARKDGLVNAATLIKGEISNAEVLTREGLPLPTDLDLKKAILEEILHFSTTQLPPKGIGAT